VTIALDTNVLVNAHRAEAPDHVAALRCIEALAAGPRALALPWPCLYEFLRVVTHRRVFDPPSPMAQAWTFLTDLLDLPRTRVLGETDHHAEILASLLVPSGVDGNLVHDAHIAALLLDHGITDLVTTDRDFLRFQGIRALGLDLAPLRR
jgi:hypothetical protein